MFCSGKGGEGREDGELRYEGGERQGSNEGKSSFPSSIEATHSLSGEHSGGREEEKLVGWVELGKKKKEEEKRRWWMGRGKSTEAQKAGRGLRGGTRFQRGNVMQICSPLSSRESHQVLVGFALLKITHRLERLSLADSLWGAREGASRFPLSFAANDRLLAPLPRSCDLWTL